MDAIDVRIAYFARAANELARTMFLLAAAGDCLADKNWRDGNMRARDEESLVGLVEGTRNVLLLDTLIGEWTILEACLRRIIFSLTGAHPTNAIVNHCKELYGRHLRHERAPEFENFVQFVTTLRNCCHNNFHYYPPNGADSAITYRGVVHQFRVGHPIMLSWDMVCDVVRGLFDMYKSTIEHPAVAAIETIR